MRILYITTPSKMGDCLADGVFYGLRKKLGADVVDFPKNDLMYKGCEVPEEEIYGRGWLLWKTLDEVERPMTDVFVDMFQNKYDVVIFSDIVRSQDSYTHFNVFKYFEATKAKFVFLDGTDDGHPTVVDAFHKGIYFKRDNPYKYPEINYIGLSIPEDKILKDKPHKTRMFTTHVQCREAYNIEWIKDNCTPNPIFTKAEDYYKDLASSKYGITMKKSGWDTPRHMENAANWAVNCIWSQGWEWDNVDFYHRDPQTHPLGFKDMENCIIWDTAEDLVQKIQKVEGNGLYNKLSEASHEWVKTKTCEKCAEYVLSKL